MQVRNGRLAMIANLGFWTQFAVTKKSLVQNLQDHIADPGHNNSALPLLLAATGCIQAWIGTPEPESSVTAKGCKSRDEQGHCHARYRVLAHGCKLLSIQHAAACNPICVRVWPSSLPYTGTDPILVCAVCESSVGPAVVGACVLIGVLPFLTDVFSAQKKEDYEGRYPALPFDG